MMIDVVSAIASPVPSPYWCGVGDTGQSDEIFHIHIVIVHIDGVISHTDTVLSRSYSVSRLTSSIYI
jgi:hypothetical protein